MVTVTQEIRNSSQIEKNVLIFYAYFVTRLCCKIIVNPFK